jgi:hypothetical protein
MDLVQTVDARHTMKLHGRDRRALNLSTKLTTIEAKTIEDAASRAGKTPSEWAREALLQAAQGGSTDPIGMEIFAECVGSQMLLMNAFEPLLKMTGMSAEQIKALFQQVQKTKAIQARELLARRAKCRAEEARKRSNDIPG